MRCLFKSKLSIKFEEFVDVRIASGSWNRSYDYNLHHFDKYIATNYPSYEELTVEMLNWCKRRETEETTLVYQGQHPSEISSNMLTKEVGQP